MGHQVMLPITKGELDLGPWEQVFYAEFDGQRKKRVVVKVMGRGVTNEERRTKDEELRTKRLANEDTDDDGFCVPFTVGRLPF